MSNKATKNQDQMLFKTFETQIQVKLPIINLSAQFASYTSSISKKE